MTEIKEAFVPDIGDYSNVPVIEVLVAVGDTVSKGQSLITLESDKATMEVPSSTAGIIKEIKVKVGDTLSQGHVVALIEVSEETAGVTTPMTVNTPATRAHNAAPPEDGGSLIEVRVPDIGDYSNVPVIEVLAAVGDTVSKDQSLITLESDKATLEVPSSATGVIKQLKVNVGDTLSQGDIVVVLQSAESTPLPPATNKPALPPNSSPARDAISAPASPAGTPSTPPITFDANTVLPSKIPYASPAVRLLARQLGVDLSRIKGSEKNGRITREDVQKFVNATVGTGIPEGRTPSASVTTNGGLNLLPWPNVDFSKFGEIETQPLSRIKKISGANLARNWAMIPHVTQFDQADITELEALRVQINKENAASNKNGTGIKLTVLAFLIKASAAALKKFPTFNASLDATGETLTLKKYFHIGFAADTPNGLVVPVIRNVDQKGIVEIAQETSDLAKKARDGKLTPADMSGGCFSISSLGGIGGTAFTPIINAPEVAILGVSKSLIQPIWDGTQFAPKMLLPLSLSYDHRVIDGALAAHFTTYLSQILADMRRVLL
ncbi:dihydrolipoyllysine-residue acetyltransferase [Xylella fastidiosa]|uniref:dihydrolipoyllysine-residue acetyltransferase n=1 Tax=Xylella fastidiosa TaxID=2371 RepID=UPI0007336D01|nr:dihydrolipoyllysine-residue acetyltransferase [Xylella fastidiosa]